MYESIISKYVEYGDVRIIIKIASEPITIINSLQTAAILQWKLNLHVENIIVEF